MSDGSSAERAAQLRDALGEDWVPTSTLQALHALTKLSAQVTPTIARRAALTPNELRALEQLMDGPVGPAELARVLGVSSAAVSGIVDRLEARGHAERSAHGSDRRRTAVTISPSGRREVAAYLMPMFRELARLDAELSDEDRVVVDRYLQGAIRAIQVLL